MTDGLISVIVPVYNVERYLATCLDSIINQDYTFIEVIVIDDGSTDYSLEIARQYSEKDDRIKLYSFNNSGLSAARNHGISVATGEYITFVDSDDILLPKALSILMQVRQENNADIVEGVTVKGKTLGKIEYKNFYKTQIFTPLKAIENVLYQKDLSNSVCGKLFLSSLFDKVIFENGLIYEDLDIFYKIFLHSTKIAKTDFPVYFYRETEGSILQEWDSKRLDVIKVTEHIEDYMKKNLPELASAASDRRLSANFNMFALCSKNGDQENALKCWTNIKSHRRKSLWNPKVRLKNKAGILLSFLGKGIFRLASQLVYK